MTIFHLIWGMVDDDLFDLDTGHRLLGSWFGYPLCCTEFFIKNYDKPDLTWVCMVDNDKGTYVQCHSCWQKENL
jgi:hypothetical protein